MSWAAGCLGLAISVHPGCHQDASPLPSCQAGLHRQLRLDPCRHSLTSAYRSRGKHTARPEGAPSQFLRSCGWSESSPLPFSLMVSLRGPTVLLVVCIWYETTDFTLMSRCFSIRCEKREMLRGHAHDVRIRPRRAMAARADCTSGRRRRCGRFHAAPSTAPLPLRPKYPGRCTSSAARPAAARTLAWARA